jgi:hypothetical protein
MRVILRTDGESMLRQVRLTSTACELLNSNLSKNDRRYTLNAYSILASLRQLFSKDPREYPQAATAVR